MAKISKQENDYIIMKEEKIEYIKWLLYEPNEVIKEKELLYGTEVCKMTKKQIISYDTYLKNDKAKMIVYKYFFNIDNCSKNETKNALTIIKKNSIQSLIEKKFTEIQIKKAEKDARYIINNTTSSELKMYLTDKKSLEDINKNSEVDMMNVLTYHFVKKLIVNRKIKKTSKVKTIKR